MAARIIQGLFRVHEFLVPHYCVNFMLASSYFVFKTSPLICRHLFETCILEMRELEMLTFLGCLIVIKNRRSSSARDHFNAVCMFSKVLGLLLFFNQHPLYAIVFAAFCLVHLVFLPEPGYEGPQYITYFNGENLMPEMQKDSRVTWIIECYATWSPPCMRFSDIFARISAKYNTTFLKFGKIDMSRHQNIAQQFNISTSSWSRQLPTVLVLRAGKEIDRRPGFDGKGTVTKYNFTEENITHSLDLGNLYLEAKKRDKKPQVPEEKEDKKTK